MNLIEKHGPGQLTVVSTDGGGDIEWERDGDLPEGSWIGWQVDGMGLLIIYEATVTKSPAEADPDMVTVGPVATFANEQWVSVVWRPAEPDDEDEA